ncbi:MAG: sigma 54-interacting transcriptional regulator [Pseudomonadota bacterium]
MKDSISNIVNLVDPVTPVSVELQSLVDSHEQPFVVIDRDYRILAINSAYEKTFGVRCDKAVGLPCYKVSHDSEVPCHESGEDCPHANMFEIGKSDSCLHVHFDSDHRMCQVRVTAFPLRGNNGELYMGELIQQLSGPEDRRVNGRRMVGQTPPFLACIDQMKMIAAASAPVLLQGETGTGKELAAHFIHSHSMRREQPFLTVDCTVLTEPLFEAEVFGHARGAYTGSVGDRTGLFEQADRGTLFLDEVGELPLSQQAKLLRVLETGQYRRVGGKGTRNADVRIVCATNRHLWELVSAGRFREDLYYRIACLSVRLPALRERLDDIEVLAPDLLGPVSHTMNQKFKLTQAAIERLKLYDYPGNVRELRNILFIAATHSSAGEIDDTMIETVLQQLAHGRNDRNQKAPAEAQPLVTEASPGKAGKGLHEVEAKHIAELLVQHHDNRRQVAAVLGVSERTLYRKLKRYNLN